MTSKSSKQKQKQLSSSNRHQIRFNQQQFNLGDRKIRIDNTQQVLKQLIIQLYKTKRLPQVLYQIKQNSKFKQSIQLTNDQIIQIVRDRVKFSHQNIISNINRIYRNIQLKNQSLPNYNIFCQNNKLKSTIEAYRAKINQALRHNEQLKIQKQLKIRNYLQKIIIKTQKQIFINSIVLLIENRSSDKNETQSDIPVTIVLEQCFPNIQLSKSKLIQLIGLKRYNQLISKTITTYLRQNKQANQLFLVCHHCMKVIYNIQKQAISCQAKSKEQMLESHIMSDPHQYYHKLIMKDHFQYTFQTDNYKQQRIRLPYFQYFNKVQYKVQQQKEIFFKCNRLICLECFLANRKNNKQIIIQQEEYICNTCNGNCNCNRCRMQQKLIRLMGYYLNLKGDLKNLVKIFILNENSFENTFRIRKIIDNKFIYKQTLETMIQFYQSFRGNIINQQQIGIREQSNKSNNQNIGYDSSLNPWYPAKCLSNTQNTQQASLLYFGLAKKQIKTVEELRIIKNRNKLLKLKEKQKKKMTIREKMQKAGITNQEVYECYKKDQQELINKLKNSTQKIFHSQLPIDKGNRQLIRPQSFIRKYQRRLLNLPIYFHTPFGIIPPELIPKKLTRQPNAKQHKDGKDQISHQKKQVSKNSFGSIWDQQNSDN